MHSSEGKLLLVQKSEGGRGRISQAQTTRSVIANRWRAYEAIVIDKVQVTIRVDGRFLRGIIGIVSLFVSFYLPTRALTWRSQWV